MKFFTQHTVPKDKGQFISNMQTKYKLNAVTGLVEEDGEVDMQQLIQSSEDCALAKQLELFGVDFDYTSTEEMCNHSDDAVAVLEDEYFDKLDRQDRVRSVAEQYHTTVDQLPALLAAAEQILRQQQQQRSEVEKDGISEESPSDEAK